MVHQRRDVRVLGFPCSPISFSAEALRPGHRRCGATRDIGRGVPWPRPQELGAEFGKMALLRAFEFTAGMCLLHLGTFYEVAKDTAKGDVLDFPLLVGTLLFEERLS